MTTNKAFNPLFLSALDILTGALGVFIILNFLQTRAVVPPPLPTPKTAEKQQEKSSSGVAPAARPPQYTGRYWQKPVEPARPDNKPAAEDPKPVKPATQQEPPSQPQDPVAVDLLKQTKGAVVLLLQQVDQAKVSVEMMLRQGNRTWKPSSSSKYQDETFAYEKRLNYFYQHDIQPGTYEVLVRVKKGMRNGGAKNFALFGKIIPTGQKTKTYRFGDYSVNGSASDWVSAGTFQISAGDLSLKGRLPAAVPTSKETDVATTGAPAPASSKKRGGKWD